MSASEALESLATQRIIPVISSLNESRVEPLVDVLIESGLTMIEVTLRRPESFKLLEAFCRYDNLIVGAGTVLNRDQVIQANDLGAQFVVSPGLSLNVLEEAKALSIQAFPGIATPSEIMLAISAGVRCVKFFPAEALGGTDTLKALAAPFPGITFMPTGGINGSTAERYLILPFVAAVGSSWIVDSQLVDEGNWQAIRERCNLMTTLSRS